MRSTLSAVFSSALLESSPHPENKFTLNLSISWFADSAILFVFSKGSALSVSWCLFAGYLYFGISIGASKKYYWKLLKICLIKYNKN